MARITNAIREKVFELNAKGYSTWEIAEELDLSEFQVVRILGL